MKIPLDLGHHCIETAAKLRLERMIQSYFKHPDPGTDEQIRALTWFLENGDFPELRTALTGISRAVLNFSKNPHGVEIKTEGGPLKMIWKNLPGSGW